MQLLACGHFERYTERSQYSFHSFIVIATNCRGRRFEHRNSIFFSSGHRELAQINRRRIDLRVLRPPHSCGLMPCTMFDLRMSERERAMQKQLANGHLLEKVERRLLATTESQNSSLYNMCRLYARRSSNSDSSFSSSSPQFWVERNRLRFSCLASKRRILISHIHQECDYFNSKMHFNRAHFTLNEDVLLKREFQISRMTKK